MHRFTKLISFAAGQAQRFARDDSGATAIEYAMIAVGVAVAIVAAVNSLGTTTSSMYDSVATATK